MNLISLVFAVVTFRSHRRNHAFQVHLVRTWPQGGSIRNILGSLEIKPNKNRNNSSGVIGQLKQANPSVKTLGAFCLCSLLLWTLLSSLKAQNYAAWLCFWFMAPRRECEKWSIVACLNILVKEISYVFRILAILPARLWLQGHGQVGACISYFNLEPCREQELSSSIHMLLHVCVCTFCVCVPAGTSQPTPQLHRVSGVQLRASTSAALNRRKTSAAAGSPTALANGDGER